MRDQSRVAGGPEWADRVGELSTAARLLSGYHVALETAIEWRHYRALGRFVERLEPATNVFYMFFTSGLLHWVTKALEFVPDRVNVALIGSALRPEEVDWVRRTIRRPFHHVELAIDDKTVWRLLFEAARGDFGWLDIDCFIVNAALFDEAVDLSPDVSMSYLWAHRLAGDVARADGPTELIRTHFLFLSAKAREALRKSPLAAGPCTYNYTGSRYGRNSSYGYSRIPRGRHIDVLRRQLQPEPSGLPGYPRRSFRAFDTLVLYQLMSQAMGYCLKRLRPLGGPRDPNYGSAEALHVGSVSYFERWKSASGRLNEWYTVIGALDHMLMASQLRKLPAIYHELLAGRLAACATDVTDSEALQRGIHKYVVGLGVPAHVIDDDERLAFLRPGETVAV